MRALAWAGASTPAAAWACPACFSAANPGVLQSYYATAVFLTLTPLLLVGGFVLWLAWQQRRRDTDGRGGNGPG